MEGAAAALSVRLPDSLAVFARLAFNYRWAWAHEGPGLLEAIDAYGWHTRRENPVRVLLEAPAEWLIKAARDRQLIERAEELERRVQADLERPPSVELPGPVAFLCAEYGVHRSMPTYSGGLGILAGDILKEASDQAVPMVGVGILYRQGYFHQNVDRSGWQHEFWIESDPARLPAAVVTGDDGLPLTVPVPLRGRDVLVQIWRVDVGRVPLYLLDAQRPENSRADRWITARLYVGDRKIRLAQYALLGIGGILALRALGIEPSVYHLNEGHAALAPLELTREGVRDGLSYEEAAERARRKTVFTTHTPVPAGNEAYGIDEIRDVLDAFPEELGAGHDRFLDLGRAGDDAGFGLTPVSIRMSRATNGVSRLHEAVARSMWRPMFGDGPSDEVPIGHVTNGVHLPTWMSPVMRGLLDMYLGEGWQRHADEPATWDKVDAIPDDEIWALRNELRSNLVTYVRDRSTGDRLARGEPIDYAEAAARVFDPDVLTLGFARRVAGYKRLTLLLKDPQRAEALLQGERPVQLLLAGKAHPQDDHAKAMLQSVFGFKLDPAVAERAVFLEDYDMGMAQQLVWGCDVWLNVPRPPLEASGTSGMKSALNGGLNLSVRDGWWAEAYDGTNGWAIGDDEFGIDAEQRDEADARSVYELMEREVVPAFYERDEDGIPREWTRRVKASLRSIGPRFCATRMLKEYLRDVYVTEVPAAAG